VAVDVRIDVGHVGNRFFHEDVDLLEVAGGNGDAWEMQASDELMVP
jgi:hypothetical protein